jgi:uncharacterized protein (AIM24 family)
MYNLPMITHEIIGDDMQAVVITLAAGDEVRAEAGAMTYMTDGIDMDARMEGGLTETMVIRYQHESCTGAVRRTAPPAPRRR